METTEIIIRQNGTLTERVVRERDLDAEQPVLDALTEGVTRSLRNALSIPEWGLVHANIGITDTLWTAVINRIPFTRRPRRRQRRISWRGRQGNQRLGGQ